MNKEKLQELGKIEWQHYFRVLSKKPIFMTIDAGTVKGFPDVLRLYIGCNELSIEMSRRNLKKLFLIIAARLKGKKWTFDDNNKVVEHLDNREIVESPADEILKQLSTKALKHLSTELEKLA